MPTHRIHKLVTKLILGEEIAKVKRIQSVHFALDFPAFGRNPKGHRKYYHTPLSAMLMGESWAPKNASETTRERFRQVALLHILTDKACENPNVEKLLELLAAYDRR